MGAVAVVIGIFFVVGLFVGAVVVIALPALRHQWVRRARRRDLNRQPGSADVRPRDTGAARWEGAAADDRPRWPGYAARREEQAADDRPRWTGDSDDGYSGRKA